MQGSVFNKFSIDRKIIKWEKHLDVETPVQKIGEMFFKRDDYFAPLGYGGINGAKLRQCIFLINEKRKTIKTVYSGASVLSPQIPMSSAVCKHYGLRSVNVVGATKPESVLRNKMMDLATRFGAELDFIKVGFNPALQRRVKELVENDVNSTELKYGIAVDSKDNMDKIRRFHLLSARQVLNIPEHIEDLVIPSGSCNSTISILYGLNKYISGRKKHMNVHLVGIGPRKIEFIRDRLPALSNLDSYNYLDFKIGKGALYKMYNMPKLCKFTLNYYDLHTTKYVTYSQKMPYDYKGVKLHPTYEGKVMTYLKDKLPELEKPTTLFWIVGSEPDISFMPIKIVGEKPKKVNNHLDSIYAPEDDWEKIWSGGL